MLRPQHLPLLAVFAQLCRDGSFTAAARSLGLSKSVVSSHLRKLEAVLDARLLERSTRRIALTQTGEQVLAAAERMLAAAEDVNLVGQAQGNVPTGTLRVASPVNGAELIGLAVARLCAKYPNLRAELILTDSHTDLIRDRLDATLTANVPKDSSLVSTRLAEDVEIIVASPKLAAAWRRAKQPKDLSGAPFVAHANVPSSNRRRFRSSSGKVQHLAPSEPRIVANTTEAVRLLVVGGVGFAVVPSQVVVNDIEAGRMVQVLPQWCGRVIRIHLCRPSLEHPPARVVAFVRELQSVFALMGYKARYTDAALRYALRPPP